MKHDDWSAELLKRQAAEWDIFLDGAQVEALERFSKILDEYTVANVIGTKGFSKILEDHVLDSLSCMIFEGFKEASSLLDVGSGAGLPGIPLKIAQPDLQLDLLEATAKKSRFQQLAASKLDLDVRSINARAEVVGRGKEYRGRYDLATARALSSLATVAEYCAPLLKVGGYGIAMKASLDEKELDEGERAASVLGAMLSEVIEVPIATGARAKERRLVIIKKIRETPNLYPRRAAEIKKRPLGRKD